jgi:hypothetical protein
VEPSRPDPSQTELFQAPTPEAQPAAPAPPEKPAEPEDSANRIDALRTLLELCTPVRAGSKAAAWLKERRVFRKTWDAQGLRCVDHYHRAHEDLVTRFPAAQLTAWGLFNKEGHLRFYRHSLLLPWFDGGQAVYLQARALDAEVKPEELSIASPVPCPYNAGLLNGEPGRLYLCAGALDTLILLEAGFPAVGVPADTGLKPSWLPRFRNKSVFVAFDADARGEARAAKTIALLTGGGIEAHRLQVPPGKEVGEWLAGK